MSNLIPRPRWSKGQKLPKRQSPQPAVHVGTLEQQLRKVFGPEGAPSWFGLCDQCPPLPPQPSPEAEQVFKALLELARHRPQALAGILRVVLANGGVAA
jgi:hypothetical protein